MQITVIPPQKKRAAPVIRLGQKFEFCWSPDLEQRLRQLLKSHRRAANSRETSTPEMLMRSVRREQRLEDETLQRILDALVCNQPPTIDCDLMAAMKRLKDRQREINP